MREIQPDYGSAPSSNCYATMRTINYPGQGVHLHSTVIKQE